VLPDYGIREELVYCPSAAEFGGHWRWGNIGANKYHYVGGHGSWGGDCAATSWCEDGWVYSGTYWPAKSDGIRPVSNRAKIDKGKPSENPWAFDVAYIVGRVGTYWLKPKRSNHPEPDGTGDGQNMLYADGHVAWVELDKGVSEKGKFAHDYTGPFYY
jgi:prepilin-type processing-associated H-X9-DG protein